MRTRRSAVPFVVVTAATVLFTGRMVLQGPSPDEVLASSEGTEETQGVAERQSGVQVTPDDLRTLISKDVGGERWAISRNLDDLTVTGNVFFPAGGDPLFVYCDQTGETGEDLNFDCFGANKCGLDSCPEFGFLSAVTLPQSFFAVPGNPQAAGAAIEAALALVEAGSADTGETQGVGERQSGVQITPDDAAILISKDVGGERWAITRDLGDQSVTGNVFFPAGGDPLFVYCEQTGQNGTDLNFDCFGADKCGLDSCPEFAFLSAVTLPESFFAIPTGGPTPTPTPGGGEMCGNGAAEGTEDCDGADLDGTLCEDIAGFECTGNLACSGSCEFDASDCNCPCESDFDCDIVVDCTAFVEDCEVFGACQNGSCVTNPVGTAAICNGNDPDPDFPEPRCEAP